jgi:hypothetical protein
MVSPPATSEAGAHFAGDTKSEHFESARVRKLNEKQLSSRSRFQEFFLKIYQSRSFLNIFPLFATDCKVTFTAAGCFLIPTQVFRIGEKYSFCPGFPAKRRARIQLLLLQSHDDTTANEPHIHRFPRKGKTVAKINDLNQMMLTY